MISHQSLAFIDVCTFHKLNNIHLIFACFMNRFVCAYICLSICLFVEVSDGGDRAVNTH